MNNKELFNLLREVHNDPSKLALATVDIAYPELPDNERITIKTALMVAAIPHWCDAEILKTLLEVSQPEAVILLDRLSNLKIVEPFPARGDNAINVHESTRLTLRKQMARGQQDRFRTLSSQVQAYFEKDLTPSGRIEWLYHFLIADPDEGAAACKVLDQKWTSEAHPEDRYALELALAELENSNLLEGHARIEALLCIGETRSYYGDIAQLQSFAEEILEQAKRSENIHGEARAYSLLGDSLSAQDHHNEAYQAYEEFLHISQKLVAQNPQNVDLQMDFAIAYSKIGDILKLLDQLNEAEKAFNESLHISRKLVEQDPHNVGMQRRLAIAHGKMGGVLQAQGLLCFDIAKEEFEKRLHINRQLAKNDPKNKSLQRDLAVAISGVGDILKRQDCLREAQILFEERLCISKALVEQDPRNVGWKRELAVSHSKLGDILLSLNQLGEAKQELDEDLHISRQLVDKCPSNARFQSDLAITLERIGGVLQAQGELIKAKEMLEECLDIIQKLEERDAGSVGLQKQKDIVSTKVKSIKEVLEESLH